MVIKLLFKIWYLKIKNRYLRWKNKRGSRRAVKEIDEIFENREVVEDSMVREGLACDVPALFENLKKVREMLEKE